MALVLKYSGEVLFLRSVILKRPENLKSLAEARDKAVAGFVQEFPEDLRSLVVEYRNLVLKQNRYRRLQKSIGLGTAHEDIKAGAGFVFEGVEALSTEEEARLMQLERVEEIQGYFAREVAFRRRLCRQEDLSFALLKKKR